MDTSCGNEHVDLHWQHAVGNDAHGSVHGGDGGHQILRVGNAEEVAQRIDLVGERHAD